MRLFLLFFVVLFIVACTEERIPIPKPRIYPKVIYPERNYTPLDVNYCAFSFEYPDYMKYAQDTTLINQAAKHSCWFTMDIPSLNGSVHFTYTDISGGDVSEKLYDVINDSYTMSEKHNLKATGRDIGTIYETDKRIYGLTYAIGGDVASPYHFMLTDSVEHALWGSLYFNCRPNADSLEPVVEFVKEDLQHVIKTFKWNEE